MISNVLIVDINALHPVHTLDFLDQVVLHFLGAADGQHVMGIHRTLGDALARLIYSPSFTVKRLPKGMR